MVFGCMASSLYGVLPASLAFGNFINTSSPGAKSLFTPGLQSSFPLTGLADLATLFVPPCLVLNFCFRGASSAELYPSSSSSDAGVESSLTDPSSSSYPEASRSIVDSASDWVVDSWDSLFFGAILTPSVTGEDLRRLDSRVGVTCEEGSLLFLRAVAEEAEAAC